MSCQIAGDDTRAFVAEAFRHITPAASDPDPLDQLKAARPINERRYLE